MSIKIFVRTILLSLIVFVYTANAQWVQASGPYGGTITSLFVPDSNTFAGTNGAEIYLSANDAQVISPFKKITENGYLQSTTIWQDWKDTIWINNSKDSLVYDGNNNVIEDLRQGWNFYHLRWANYRLITYNYDRNKLTSQLWQDWSGTNWVNNVLHTYSYDVNNNYICDTIFSWWGSWVFHQLTTNYYDDNNLKIANMLQFWHDPNWVNATLVSYTYDSNRNMIQYINQDWDGSKWVNYSKDIRIYNIGNNLISESFQLWKDSAWVNYFRYLYTFNKIHQKTKNLYQTWNGEQWVNSGRWLYNYNGNKNTEQIHQLWKGFSWANEYMYSLTYDENSHITESLQLSWYHSKWVVQSRELFSYISVTGINDKRIAPKEFVLNQNYPNPFNPSTTISFSLPAENKVTIKIYNLLGQEVKTLVNAIETAGKHQIIFNAGNLSSGIYFYTMQAGGFVQTRKLILLK